MEEGWALEPVRGSTCLLHSIGHARWTTGEHTNLGQEDVIFLEAVKELVEIRTAKVGHRTQTSEKTFARQFLEMPLTDILKEKEKE